jgi:hypothetical protein
VTQTFRCALIGYGFNARKGRAPVHAERSVGAGYFETMAIVDSNEARRAAAQRDFPKARIHSDHSEMRRALRGKARAVSPNEAVSLAEQALDWRRVGVQSVPSLSASLSSREDTVVAARPPAREIGARTNGHYHPASSRP